MTRFTIGRPNRMLLAILIGALWLAAVAFAFRAISADCSGVCGNISCINSSICFDGCACHIPLGAGIGKCVRVR